MQLLKYMNRPGHVYNIMEK